MSTIALDCPSSLQVRHTTNIQLIAAILVGLVLVASIFLVAAATPVKVASSSGVVAVPVAPTENAQIPSTAITTPAPSPVVIAVPVATPPSQ
jgi:hypothetical protein